MASERLLAVADRYAALVPDLKRAAEHARTAAGHFREGEVPRGCAHAFALEGHLRRALAELEQLAVVHADHATP